MMARGSSRRSPTWCASLLAFDPARAKEVDFSAPYALAQNTAARREFGKAVREKLTEAGCRFVRHGRGDHDIWSSSISDQNLTVPVKVMSRHMANKCSRTPGCPRRSSYFPAQK